jgi:predicted Zn-dependent protease
MSTRAIGLGLIAFLTAACPPVMYAARRIPAKELKFGYQADREVLSCQYFVLDEAAVRRVNDIGSRVAKASGGADIEFTFRVVNDPTINAYAAAGGFVYVNTGLLDILQSEDELAALLGHEIAHVNRSHQIRSIHSTHHKRQLVHAMGSAVGAGFGAAISMGLPQASSLPGMVANQVAEQKAGEVVGAGVSFVSNATLVAMVKGYSRGQELEADRLAVQYAAKAGYDPGALANVFKRLTSIRDSLKTKQPNYVSSLINAEPGLEQRITQAEKVASRARAKRR